MKMINIMLLKLFVNIYTRKGESIHPNINYYKNTFINKLNNILDKISDFNQIDINNEYKKIINMIDNKGYNNKYKISKKKKKNIYAQNIITEEYQNNELNTNYNKCIRYSNNITNYYEEKENIILYKNFKFIKGIFYEILYIYKYKKFTSNKIIYSFIPDKSFNIINENCHNQLEHIRFFIYNFIDFDNKIKIQITIEATFIQENTKNTIFINIEIEVEKKIFFKNTYYLYKLIYNKLDIYDDYFTINTYIEKIHISFIYEKDKYNNYINKINKVIHKFKNYYKKISNKDIVFLYKKDKIKHIYNLINYNIVKIKIILILKENNFDIYYILLLFKNINNKIIISSTKKELIILLSNYILYYKFFTEILYQFLDTYKLNNISYKIKKPSQIKNRFWKIYIEDLLSIIKKGYSLNYKKKEVNIKDTLFYKFKKEVNIKDKLSYNFKKKVNIKDILFYNIKK